MQFEELTCSICTRQYSNQGDLIPRLLPECGHTFCTHCLNQLLKEQQHEFFCPEDNTQCTRKNRAEDFPKNFALLRLAEKTQSKSRVSSSTNQQNAQQSEQTKQVVEVKQPQNEYSQPQSDLCPQHQRKLEIICITDKVRICSNCALFGPHKNHDIRMEVEVMNEISVRTECLMEMYELVKQNSANKVDHDQVETLYETFNHQAVELKQLVKDKFKEIKAYIKIQEQAVETNLKKNLMKVENQFKMLRDVPKQLYVDAESWMEIAHVKLDTFISNSSNPNYIAFDMLENKEAPPVFGDFNSKADIIQSGEKILMQLDGQKDVSVQKIENYMGQLNVEFDNNAINKINEICKCDLIEDVIQNIDDSSFIHDYQKQGVGKPPLGANQAGVSKKSGPSQPSSKKNVIPLKEHEIFFSGVILYLMYMYSLQSGSQQVQSNLLTSPNVGGKKTKIHSSQALEQPSDQKIRYGTYAAPQSSQNLLDTPDQQQFLQEEAVSSEVNEEIEETLINDIENYLKEVMEHNEEVMDIQETPIGNYGAKCVAAVITLCDQLKEIRLGGCNIKDEGAIAIFDELKTSESIQILDLNNNEITERSFDSLIQLLNSNKKLQRIELKGLKVKNKFTLNKLKKFGERILL